MGTRPGGFVWRRPATETGLPATSKVGRIPLKRVTTGMTVRKMEKPGLATLPTRLLVTSSGLGVSAVTVAWGASVERLTTSVLRLPISRGSRKGLCGLFHRTWGDSFQRQRFFSLPAEHTDDRSQRRKSDRPCVSAQVTELSRKIHETCSRSNTALGCCTGQRSRCESPSGCGPLGVEVRQPRSPRPHRPHKPAITRREL